MIWGLTLKPGASCTRVFNEEVHLSLVSMESRKEFGRIWPGSYSQVVMKSEGVELLLCTLVHGSIFQQNLDMKLMPNEKITFTAYGDCLIYISGYTNHIRQEEEDQETAQEFDIAGYESSMQEDEKMDPPEIESASWIPDQPDDAKTDLDSVDHLPDDRQTPTITIKEEDLGQDSTPGHINPAEPTLTALEGTPQEEDFTVIADIEDPAGDQKTTKTEAERSEVEGTKRTTTGIMKAHPSPLSARHARRISMRGTAGGQDTSHWVDLSYTLGPGMVHANEASPEGKDNSIPRMVPQGGSPYDMSETGDLQDYSMRPRPYLTLPGSSLSAGRASITRPRIDPVLTNSWAAGKARKRSNVKAPSKIKHKKKEHCCLVCQKSFIHISSLVRHERIHTGVKPYPCRICWKPFSDVGNRTKHERIHSKGKIFPCGSCRQVFLSASARQKHQCPSAHGGVGT